MNKLFLRPLLVVIFLLSFFLVFPGSANAWQFRQGDNLTITENFKESLFAVGQNISVTGKVDGDLYCAGQSVQVKGEVTGDVLCAAQDLNITGKVGGNVRSAAQTLTLDSLVARNVNLFAQDIKVNKNAKINGELYTAGSTVTIAGLVNKSWAGAAENMVLNGKVVGDAKLATSNFALGEGATVSGGITKVETKDKVAEKKFWKVPEAATQGFKTAGNIMGSIFTLILGLLIVWLFPTWLKKASLLASTQPGKSALWGLLIWFVAPVLVVLSAITLIGIPLALLLGFALMLVCGASWIIVATAVGNSLFNNKKTKLIISWFVGYLLISILSLIPVVGWIVKIAIMLIGTGAIKYSLLHTKKRK